MVETICEIQRTTDQSESILRSASSIIPGGLLTTPGERYGGEAPSTMRATLPVIAKGKGSTLTDVDGNGYLDFLAGHGSLILGHTDDRVVAAVTKAAAKGFSFGGPIDAELRLAELIVGRLLSIEMIRLVNTPLDALEYALALIRNGSGRELMVTCGNYVGGAVCRGGWRRVQPQADADTTHHAALPFNDPAAAERLFAERGWEIAAVILEPVGTTPDLASPAPGFLPWLRSLCDKHNALLVFDESVTGFRFSPGGGPLEGVLPDLTLLGPIIGGGLPLAACGGRKEVMQSARAGLFNELRVPGQTNTLALAAGIATIQAVGEPGFHDALEEKAVRLCDGLQSASVRASRVGNMLVLSLRAASDTGREFSNQGDAARYVRFHQAMLDRGILLSPIPDSCIFISAAHSHEDIDRTIEAVHNALDSIA